MLLLQLFPYIVDSLDCCYVAGYSNQDDGPARIEKPAIGTGKAKLPKDAKIITTSRSALPIIPP